MGTKQTGREGQLKWLAALQLISSRISLTLHWALGRFPQCRVSPFRKPSRQDRTLSVRCTPSVSTSFKVIYWQLLILVCFGWTSVPELSKYSLKECEKSKKLPSHVIPREGLARDICWGPRFLGKDRLNLKITELLEMVGVHRVRKGVWAWF